MEIDIGRIVKTYQNLARKAQWVIVEGVGGWQAPLNRQATVADLAHALDLPVVLVVGIRLGCLNHALLSVASIQQRGLTLAGWVANVMDGETKRVEENIHALEERIAAPLIGVVPFLVLVEENTHGRANLCPC